LGIATGSTLRTESRLRVPEDQLNGQYLEQFCSAGGSCPALPSDAARPASRGTASPPFHWQSEQVVRSRASGCRGACPGDQPGCRYAAITLDGRPGRREPTIVASRKLGTINRRRMTSRDSQRISRRSRLLGHRLLSRGAFVSLTSAARRASSSPRDFEPKKQSPHVDGASPWGPKLVCVSTQAWRTIRTICPSHG
jgi:hypothetical protein